MHTLMERNENTPRYVTEYLPQVLPRKLFFQSSIKKVYSTKVFYNKILNIKWYDGT